MAYWRSITFWVLLIVGWLIAALLFSVLTRLFASFDDMTPGELWITGITIHVLAVLAGFSFARSRTQHGNTRGFEVVQKSDDDSTAG